MSYALQLVRSLIFNIMMYVMMVVLAIVFFIPMLIHRKWAQMACYTYCHWVMWSARWMIGLKTEVRGTPPTGEVVIAAKHQSFFDIIVIYGSIPWGKFIMKRQLMYSPILGQYAMRVGCVPVNRGKRTQAIKKMVDDVNSGQAYPGQLVIYPQGTRVAPGAVRPYKVGSGVLYKELNQPCVPVAVNVGVFWPKRGIYRKPGTAVVEFMEPIAPGLEVDEFMAQIEEKIETRSNQLMAEAGFNG